MVLSIIFRPAPLKKKGRDQRRWEAIELDTGLRRVSSRMPWSPILTTISNPFYKKHYRGCLWPIFHARQLRDSRSFANKNRRMRRNHRRSDRARTNHFKRLELCDLHAACLLEARELITLLLKSAQLITFGMDFSKFHKVKKTQKSDDKCHYKEKKKLSKAKVQRHRAAGVQGPTKR